MFVADACLVHGLSPIHNALIHPLRGIFVAGSHGDPVSGLHRYANEIVSDYAVIARQDALKISSYSFLKNLKEEYKIRKR